MTNCINSLVTAIHLAALSQIETGDCDTMVGSAGEISRFQIMPSEARKEWNENPSLKMLTYTPKFAKNPTQARLVALGIWSRRLATFNLVYRRPPDLVELYLCWHRPARIFNPLPRERSRAERFRNLVLSLQTERKPPEKRARN